MILTNVVQDDTMGVPGFEHQTFTCSECHDLERRFVFTKQDRGRDGEPTPEQAAPTVAPASTVHEEHVAVILIRDPAENVLVEPTQIAPWNRPSRIVRMSLCCSRRGHSSCLHQQRRMSRLSLQVF